MKRTAILTVTAFYLLLASGMFVRAVHCPQARLAVHPEMQMAGTPVCSKPCCACRQHNCNTKHSNIKIQENVKPGYQMRFHLPLLTAMPVPVNGYTLNTAATVYNTLYTNSEAPAGPSGKVLSIQLGSLPI